MSADPRPPVLAALEDYPRATVHVVTDGTVAVSCSCGDLELTAGGGEGQGPVRYALQRLTSHMELHATAAARGVPWAEVRKQRAVLEYRQGVRDRSSRL